MQKPNRLSDSGRTNDMDALLRPFCNSSARPENPGTRRRSEQHVLDFIYLFIYCVGWSRGVDLPCAAPGARCRKEIFKRKSETKEKRREDKTRSAARNIPIRPFNKTSVQTGIKALSPVDRDPHSTVALNKISPLVTTLTFFDATFFSSTAADRLDKTGKL